MIYKPMYFRNLFGFTDLSSKGHKTRFKQNIMFITCISLAEVYLFASPACKLPFKSSAILHPLEPLYQSRFDHDRTNIRLLKIE